MIRFRRVIHAFFNSMIDEAILEDFQELRNEKMNNSLEYETELHGMTYCKRDTRAGSADIE